MITVRMPDEVDELGLRPSIKQVIRRLKEVDRQVEAHAKTAREAAEAHERLGAVIRGIVRDWT